MNVEERGWNVAWSWESANKVADLCMTNKGIAVATGLDIVLIDDDGSALWKASLPFRTFSIAVAEGVLGVLAGHGFHVIRLADGTQLHEGRATSGGFSDILPRPGGGWVLADRKEHLHLFNAEGRGMRRLQTGNIRKLVGWFDREHLLVHDEDGHICCIRMVGEDSQRRIEERKWSWCSRLEEGRIILQAADGNMWEGIPHPFGWDVLDRVENVVMEPLDGTRAIDGWWILGIDGILSRIPPIEDDRELDGGDMLTGDGSTTLVSSTREGLLRWWEAPKSALKRKRRVQSEVAQAREDLDWDNRKQVFLAARDAEDNGQLSKAAELYQKLGRSEDVRRILKLKREEV